MGTNLSAEGLVLNSIGHIMQKDGQFRLGLVFRQTSLFLRQLLRRTSARKRSVPCSAGSLGNDRFRSLAHDGKGNSYLSELSVLSFRARLSR